MLLGFIALAGFGSAQPLTIHTEVSPPDELLGLDGKLVGYTIEPVREIQKRVGNMDPTQESTFHFYIKTDSRPVIKSLDGLFEQLFRKHYPNRPLRGPAVVPS